MYKTLIYNAIFVTLILASITQAAGYAPATDQHVPYDECNSRRILVLQNYRRRLAASFSRRYHDVKRRAQVYL